MIAVAKSPAAFSEFVEAWCCAHEWINYVYETNRGNACTKCGAWCQRSPEGFIVVYDRSAGISQSDMRRCLCI